MIGDILDALRTHLAVRASSEAAWDLLRQPLHALHIGSRWERRGVYALFGPRERVPVLIVKVDHNPAYQPRLRTEWDALTALHALPELRDRVPRPFALVEAGDALILAQTGVPGTPLTVRLRQRLRHGARVAAGDHALVLEFVRLLESTSTSAEAATLPPALVVDRAAAALPADAPRRSRFLAELRREGEELGDLTLPLLPGHGDLAPSNCFHDGRRMNVIDWEGGLPVRPPLADLCVFLTYYARAVPVRGLLEMTLAKPFANAFLGDGWLVRVTAATFRRELVRYGLPAEAADYLLAATLADLATGASTTAHAQRAQRLWADALAVYAADRERSALRRSRLASSSAGERT